MEDLYLLLKQYVEDPHKAIDSLADTLEKNRGGYSVDDVVSALRGYQGERLINEAKKQGIDFRLHNDLNAFAKFLEMQDEFEGN